MTDTPAAASPPAEAAMFTRQTSGLVREFSLLDVVIMNLAGMSIGVGSAVAIYTVAAIWPGANVLVLLALGAVLSLITAAVYGLMSAAMPRSGGDYVFVGRTIHPAVGFTGNFVITTTLFIALGLYSYLTVAWGFSNTLTAFGLVAGSDSILDAGATLGTSRGWIFFIGLIVLLGSLLIAFLGDRVIRSAFRILFAIGMIGVFVMLGVLLATSQEELSSRLAGYLGEGASLEAIRAAADAAGFSEVGFSWKQTLLALPFGFWLFVGVTYTTYIGGEIKRPQRSQPYGMLIAVLLGGAAELALIASVYKMIGWDNIHAIAFLQGTAPEQLPFPTDPLVSFLAALAGGSSVIAAIIGISFIAWWILLLLFVVILPARNIFAWSFDRVMPMFLTKVSGNGTPWVANAVVGVLAVGILVLTIYSDVLNLIVNYILMISITFTIAGVAAAVFPYRRPDLFERAPAIVRTRIAGIPLVSLAGALQAVLFAYIIYAALDTPAFSGPVGTGALVFVLCVVAAGPVIYFAAQAYRKRENLDLSLMYRELPPD